MTIDQTRLSKFLSLVLRHKPEHIGLTLDPEGWVAVDDLLRRSAKAGTDFSRDDLLTVIATSEKKRFTLSPDGQRIRAAQGHSVAIDLGLSPIEPPDILFHGTASRFLEAILAEGLKPQSRQHVHLSLDEPTALAVGARHGKPIILSVDCRAMHLARHRFFRADNGVWLTDHVPSAFLRAL